MSDTHSIHVIAHIHTQFPTKFGIPRQSGLVEELRGTVVFAPEYRNPDALRGLESRLGGNRRMGVFATRSPFRPNPIGLSSVRLLGVEHHPELGPVLQVAGADLMDGTPIYDIKPYIATDLHPDAAGGFTLGLDERRLEVAFPSALLDQIPAEHRAALLGVLSRDPRPSYQKDSERLYGLTFAGWDIQFTIWEGVLTVRHVRPC